MEYLQGRALTNAVGNLNIQEAYADALRKFGLQLEEVAEQVKITLCAKKILFLRFFSFLETNTINQKP